MKLLIIIAIFLGICYYFFQPQFNTIFGKVTSRYEQNVAQNKALSE